MSFVGAWTGQRIHCKVLITCFKQVLRWPSMSWSCGGLNSRLQNLQWVKRATSSSSSTLLCWCSVSMCLARLWESGSVALQTWHCISWSRFDSQFFWCLFKPLDDMHCRSLQNLHRIISSSLWAVLMCIFRLRSRLKTLSHLSHGNSLSSWIFMCNR